MWLKLKSNLNTNRLGCWLLLLLLGLSNIGLGQDSELNDFYGNPVGEPTSLSFGSDQAKAILERILAPFGAAPDISVSESRDTTIAFADLVDGRPAIFYNAEYMSRAANQDWIALAVIAHEIGHLFNYHLPVGTRDQPKLELQADYFSGFALAKLGATLEQAQLAYQNLDEEASPTHPARRDRLAEVERGWRAGIPIPLDPPGTTVRTAEELVRRVQEGGTVKVAAGRYVLDTPLRLTQGLALIGEGVDKTHIVSSAENYVLHYSSEENLTLDGISFEHVGELRASVVVVASGSVDIRNSRFSGGKNGDRVCESDDFCTYSGQGLLIRGNTTGNIQGNQLENNHNGIQISDTAAPRVQNNIIRNNTGVGVAYFDQAAGLLINSNVIEFNESHGVSTSSAQPTIQGNEIRNNAGAGIELSSNWFSGFVSRVPINGNTILNNGLYGIIVQGAFESTIGGNIIQGNELGATMFYESDDLDVTSLESFVANNNIQGIVSISPPETIMDSLRFREIRSDDP